MVLLGGKYDYESLGGGAKTQRASLGSPKPGNDRAPISPTPCLTRCLPCPVCNK